MFTVMQTEQMSNNDAADSTVDGQRKHPFLASSYTIDNYKREVMTGTSITLAEHAEKIRSCIANSTLGYIVKRDDPVVGFKYIEMIERDLKNILSFNVPFKKEEKKIDPNGNEYVSKASISYKNVVDVIKNAETMPPDMKYYNNLVMVSHSSDDLSLYIPPQGAVDVALARGLVDFMRSRIKNPRAFDELISSHAYRLRHPDAWIEKCFIHFSVEGNTGKSFLAAMLGSLYPKLANVAVKHSQLTENANGWATDYLMIHVEELEGDEYLKKDFSSWIKRATTRDTSIRKMYRDAYAGTNNAIIGLNTNKKDLYGLLYGDEALLSRLVILDFDEPLTPDEWSAHKKSFGLDETNPNYAANKRKLAASLWHYLRYEYEIVERFNPCRYFEPEKTALINRLRQSAGRAPELFVNSLEKKGASSSSEGYNYYEVFEFLRDKRYKATDMSHVKVVAYVSDLETAWRAFMQDKKGAQANYSFDKSVVPILERIGFEKKINKSNHGRTMYVLSDYNKFNEWYDNRNATEDEDGDNYDNYE